MYRNRHPRCGHVGEPTSDGLCRQRLEGAGKACGSANRRCAACCAACTPDADSGLHGMQQSCTPCRLPAQARAACRPQPPACAAGHADHSAPTPSHQSLAPYGSALTQGGLGASNGINDLYDLIRAKTRVTLTEGTVRARLTRPASAYKFCNSRILCRYRTSRHCTSSQLSRTRLSQ